MCPTFHMALKSGKRENMSTAVDTMTKAWKEEGSREARQMAANMAAFREIELDTLKKKRN